MIGPGDEAYIRREFRELSELALASGREPDLARELRAAGVLPEPTYVLDDGSEWVPADYFALLDAATTPAAVRELFARRMRAAHAELAETEVEEEWQAYLSGEYGACLHEVTPEAIVRKGVLMTEIESLLRSPLPDRVSWRKALGAAVAELDALERPFADYDRERFGGPVSRDRLISDVRERFPQAFTSESG